MTTLSKSRPTGIAAASRLRDLGDPLVDAPGARQGGTPSTVLRCIACKRPFIFVADEPAVILKHVAYGYDFAHPGACLETARDWLFPEPGHYDGYALGLDRRRATVLRAFHADGWAAVLPPAPERFLERFLTDQMFRFEPLRAWVLVEYRDGSRRIEGLVRDPDWEDEPGGAEFPEGKAGRRDAVGYASAEERTHPACLAEWTAILRARYRGEPAPAGPVGVSES